MYTIKTCIDDLNRKIDDLTEDAKRYRLIKCDESKFNALQREIDEYRQQVIWLTELIEHRKAWDELKIESSHWANFVSSCGQDLIQLSDLFEFMERTVPQNAGNDKTID